MSDPNDLNDPKWTVIQDDRIRGVICDLMFEMLDNPDKNGIYPTSRFMSKMEQFVLDERRGRAQREWKDRPSAADSVKAFNDALEEKLAESQEDEDRECEGDLVKGSPAEE